MDKLKTNKFNESLELTEEQEINGVSIINNRRCHHGLNFDQIDEMNDLGFGLEEYKKLKGLD